MLISFAVTAKLICVFDFAYADCWCSNEEAQIYKINQEDCVSSYSELQTHTEICSYHGSSIGVSLVPEQWIHTFKQWKRQ